MAFRTKSFTDITRSMLGHYRATQARVTDTNVGAVARVMLEAPAAEIDELYQAMAAGLVEGIPTAIYRSFDFPLLPAKSASGVLRFTAPTGHTAAVTIPVGYLAASPSGQRYQTAEAATIAVGQTTADVLATALSGGAAGNAPAGTVTRVISSSAGPLTVTNRQAFANGTGLETEAQRRLRFIEFVRSLARGTVGSLLYAARRVEILDPSTGASVERVVRATVAEGLGHVDLYVHNGAGNTSAALVAKVVATIEGSDDPLTGLPVAGWRPAGMRVDVAAMTETPVAVSLQAEVPVALRSETLRGRIAAAIAAAIRAVPNRSRLLPLDLVNAAVSVTGVSGAVIVAPTLTVQCPAGVVLVPGVIAVAWL